MISDIGDDVAEIGFGIKIVQPCGFDNRVDNRGALAAGVGPRKQPVLATQGQGTDCTLCYVVLLAWCAVLSPGRSVRIVRGRRRRGVNAFSIPFNLKPQTWNIQARCSLGLSGTCQILSFLKH
jgi:hypothetical protein